MNRLDQIEKTFENSKKTYEEDLHFQCAAYEDIPYLLALVKKYKEALEFYGDRETWIIRDRASWYTKTQKQLSDQDMQLDYKHPGTDWVGSVVTAGKRAREALKEE